jgi:hypothetical protein
MLLVFLVSPGGFQKKGTFSETELLLVAIVFERAEKIRAQANIIKDIIN